MTKAFPFAAFTPPLNGVTLRCFTEDDAPSLTRAIGQHSTYVSTIRIPYPYSEIDAREWLAEAIPATERSEAFYFALDRGGDVIGCASLEPEPKTPEATVGYWLNEAYRERGLMTATVGWLVHCAFETLAFRRLEAHVFSFNDASRRVLEKNGFREEAYLSACTCKDGRLLDERVFVRFPPA